MRYYLLFIIILPIKGFSQNFEARSTPTIESKIIYKDGTTENGMLWLATSAFKPRVKKEHKNGSRKIDFKKIDKIITNPNSENQRIFQYLNHNYNKFKLFVELIYLDEISIYIGSENNGTDLFYSDFDRETMREKFSRMKFDDIGLNTLKNSDTLELPNGKKMAIPIRYSYYYGSSFEMASGNSPAFQYYILKIDENKLVKVEKNRRFLKKSREYFKSCPRIIEDLEEEKIFLSDLPTFIEYYKTICNTKKE